MLACVVDCSQICRARSTSRTTGCEGKLWPAEKEYDQNFLIRAFSGSIGYSEGSSTVRSESRQCLDGAFEQSDFIDAGKDGHESEDEDVENDTGIEEHPPDVQGLEKNHARVSDIAHEKIKGEEAAVKEAKPGLQLCSDRSSCRVSKSDLTARMPTKSTEDEYVSSRDIQLRSVEQTLRRLSRTPIGAVRRELGPSASVSFEEEAESVDHINKGAGTRKEPQLAEKSSRSHELSGERLDVVGSRRNERSGVQLGLSSSWEDDLRGNQEQLSFQREDTVECITNVGEEDDFGFDVEEFQTSHHGHKHDEPIQGTERLSEFHTKGERSHGGQDRQRSPSPTFECLRKQNETTLRARTGSRLQANVHELDVSRLPDYATGGRQIPERLEVGAGRVGKGQEKDLLGEGRLRKSGTTIVSDERRVRTRLDVPAACGRGEETEEASTKIVRPSRPSGGKDRHSKVNTAKGPRDRRVRLSVPTAVQFYDVQDRLGYDQPSKAVEWLIKKAKTAIDELGRVPTRGNDGPSTLSDLTKPSPYSPSIGEPMSGSSSCPPAGSFSNSPFGDHIGNPISYFVNSSSQQGVSFGHQPAHARDVGGDVGLSQGHFATGQAQLAGLSFPLGQTDLSRGNPGCVEGGKPGEFTGRVESRFKARERARERVSKEKCTPGRDCGKVAGKGSSPPSLQSPPLHRHTIRTSFPAQNALPSSVHGLSLQNPHPSSLQSSLSSVFEPTMSGIMQSSQQGTLQNLIMQNPSLQSSLADQAQSSLQHPFQAPLQSTLQLTSHTMSSVQDPGMQQQLRLHRSSSERSTQRALHLGSGFTPGLCSSTFSEATSLSSSDFMSISSIPVSHSLSMSELSSFALTSPSSMPGPHFPTGTNASQIHSEFSPGPPASTFRSRPTPINQSSSKESHLQGLSRPQCQLILPPYSAAQSLPSPGGSTSSKASTSLYYPTTSPRMGSLLESISPAQLESGSFSSIRNVGYGYQRLQMMSPSNDSSSFQTSSSQLQMPARLQGLDDFEEELKSSPQPSPHGHP